MPDWKLERHYIPSLVALDKLPMQPRQETPGRNRWDLPRLTLSQTIQQYPNELRMMLRTHVPNLLEIRNSLADVCNVPHRQSSDEPNGYELDRTIDDHWLPPPFSSEDLRISDGKPLTIDGDGAQIKVDILIISDDVISRLERLIWEEEYPRHQSNDITNTVIRNPYYSVPNALRREELLSIRNSIALQMGVPARNAHDVWTKGNPPWMLTRANGEPIGFPRSIPLTAFQKVTPTPAT